jgi:predicted Zn-dependent protease
MGNIILLDGTESTFAGKVTKEVLVNLAKHLGGMNANVTPGKIDMHGYNLVKKCETRAYNHRRKQVNYNTLADLITKDPFLMHHRREQIVVLVNSDLYAPGLNWVFGGYHRVNNRDIIIVSLARTGNDPIHLKHILLHESGHMYGAAPPKRSNTYEQLGSHCSNECVMQQKMDIQSSKRHVHSLERKGKTFCSQCVNDMRKRHHHF